MYKRTVAQKSHILSTCLKQNSPKLKNMTKFISPYSENKTIEDNGRCEYLHIDEGKEDSSYLPKPYIHQISNNGSAKKHKEDFIELLTYLKNAKVRESQSSMRIRTSHTFDKGDSVEYNRYEIPINL